MIQSLVDGVKALHEKNLPHCHLSSHNVLIQQGRLYICDYGLHKTKKYAGVVIKYSNKHSWTSPELLMEKSPTP